MPLSGLAVAEIGVGGLILYSGIKGYSIADTFTYLAKGTVPQQSETIQPGQSMASTATAGLPAASDNYNVNLGAQEKFNKALVQTMAAGYGWATGQEWTALNDVIMRESGYNNQAQNPGSTAYGIFQFLDTTWATTGYSKSSQPEIQIAAGLKYIKQRYGDPAGAWNMEETAGYY